MRPDIKTLQLDSTFLAILVNFVSSEKTQKRFASQIHYICVTNTHENPAFVQRVVLRSTVAVFEEKAVLNRWRCQVWKINHS